MQVCCALFCCDHIIARGFMWSIYPYYSRLCQGHRGNRNITMKFEKARTMCIYFAKYYICKGLFSRGWDTWHPLRRPWISINWSLDLWLKSCMYDIQVHFGDWYLKHFWGTLHWRHNEHDGVSTYRRHDCLPKRLFRHRSKKTSKLCVTGLCVGN